jgi:vacuolar-type H+-ATPase subunit D/Vma8
VIFLSPFIYVSAPKVLANQTAAVFELLSGGRDIDKMGEKFKNEIHEDISVKSLEESIREMLDDRKKEAEA